jgi:hypothetical protein
MKCICFTIVLTAWSICFAGASDTLVVGEIETPPAYATAQPINNPQKKIAEMTMFRNLCLGCMTIGSAAVVVGIAMIVHSGGYTYYENINGQESGSLEGGFGASFAESGVSAVLGGGLLVLLLNHDINKMKQQYMPQKVSLRFLPASKEIYLVYNFAL